MKTEYKDFDEFYKFYLLEHSNKTCRSIHFWGSTFFVASLIASIAFQYWPLALVGCVLGYGSAWVSHYFVEGNTPTSFANPVWSMHAGRKMYLDDVAAVFKS